MPTLALLGPTASGKSSLAVRLALHLRENGRPAEIVNADSMLVYRGMDIGTAKPTPEERAGVPHHLIDILDVRETATVADFQRLARAAIASCRERDVLPVVVGGSALYLRAILDEFTFPGTDPEVRAALEAEVAAVGSAALYERLSQLAPEAAAGIEPMNARRVVRALEVIALTGSYRSSLPEHRYALPDVVQVGLSLDRATMDARIDARVADMWRRGLVAEVEGLAERGLREGRTASRALGYQQVLAYLDGTCTEEQARSDTAVGTRRFARKQLGWWRRDPRITWVDALDLPSPADLIAVSESRL
ncbi:MAG: tRNA (adenosine(37)-N6)-dimethylallyltransferase MiaA [Propionibacteriaceae bacterium]